MTTKLSAEQKQLLETDFGSDLEKFAEEKLAACENCYDYGFSKIATEVANDLDAMYKAAEEDEKKEEKEEKEEEGEDKGEKKEDMEDKEYEKAAAELGSFIERGMFDGLRKLGSERHGSEVAYLEPLILQKVAEELFVGAVDNFVEKTAASDEDKRYLRRALLGNPISAAIEAPKGERLKRFGKAQGHSLAEAGKGALGGALGGGLVGAAMGGKGSRGPGALLGAALGGMGGAAIGGVKGQFDEKATKIHQGK